MKLSALFKQEDRTLIEKYCQSSVWNAYQGDHVSLCRVLGEILMYVDTHDLSLTPHLLARGYWEMWVSQAIASYVKPGMSCIDVGANIGYFTLLLSDLVGEQGFVEAFEPQPRLCELLQRSISVNGFGRKAQVLQYAVSDVAGSGTLTEHPRLMGSASLASMSGLPDISRRQVKVVTLDGLVPRERPIDFVKIDVQGYELRVLRGMKQLILGSPKIAIAMEFTPADHEDPMSVLFEIQKMGLLIGSIGTDGLIRSVTAQEASVPDTGGHRMLWLTRAG